MPCQYTHHLIVTDLPDGDYAQAALADLDNGGRQELVILDANLGGLP